VQNAAALTRAAVKNGPAAGLHEQALISRIYRSIF
jgi:hypothetical protein